jgi:hypothetical protein
VPAQRLERRERTTPSFSSCVYRRNMYLIETEKSRQSTKTGTNFITFLHYITELPLVWWNIGSMLFFFSCFWPSIWPKIKPKVFYDLVVSNYFQNVACTVTPRDPAR